MHIPVGNGEGQMVMLPEVLAQLNANDQIAYRYVQADGLPAAGAFPMNPNGSMEDIAAVTDPSGRVLATMPHPERGMFFTQREDWPLHKELLRRAGKPLPVEADGMQIFANAVKYFQ
jgi:phosphoribosylformylglycinamidine synthase